MIKTRISAVTSVTYGLLSALIIAVIVGSLSAAGVGVENVFSVAGNGISANASATPPQPNPIGTPNSALLAYQQSQITNSAAEIAAGTASAACLQNMNSSDNAASMASNNATCLGPGYGIAPPALPVAFEPGGSYNNNSGTLAVEPNGLIYGIIESPGTFSATSATPSPGSFAVYSDGYMQNDGLFQGAVTQCQAPVSSVYQGAGTATVINNGNELVCSGVAYAPGGIARTNPFGYVAPW